MKDKKGGGKGMSSYGYRNLGKEKTREKGHFRHFGRDPLMKQDRGESWGKDFQLWTAVSGKERDRVFCYDLRVRGGGEMV